MAITIGIVGRSGILINKPSTAEATEMGGVIIPSASKAQPPIMAGRMSHFPFLRTNENSEKMPPSPLLSAFSVMSTYLMVVCSVNVQNTQEIAPRIKLSLMTSPLIIALNTYKGEVPMSP